MRTGMSATRTMKLPSPRRDSTDTGTLLPSMVESAR